jgi:hypothetical protein
MPRHDAIHHEELRTLIDAAYQSMRKGDGTDAVHKLCVSFARLAQVKPEYGQRRAQMRFRQVPAALRWPALGANLKPESIRSGAFEFEFVRERFAVSEAMTYYEFTVDTALSLGA